MSGFDDYLFVDRLKKLRGFEKLLLPQTRQAVMVIEAPQDMGKTWLIGKMRQHCQEPPVDLPVAQIDFRNPREIHEIQDVLGLLRLLRDKLDHDSYFNHLNATINNFTEPDLSAGSSGLSGLRRNVETHFNLDELRGLCFDLDVTYDNLSGETLQRKAVELIAYCRRRKILSQLVEQCLVLRPDIDWKVDLADLWEGDEGEGETATSTSLSAGVSTPTSAFISDNDALLHAAGDVERRHAERQINNAFFDCLAALLTDKQPLVFLFDSYEAAPPEARRWLIDKLLPRLRDEQLNDVVIILTGRKTPDLTDLNMKHLLVETRLTPFVETDVREYIEDRRQISGLDLRTVILTSGGVPGALAMMADHAQITSEDGDDFFSDL